MEYVEYVSSPASTSSSASAAQVFVPPGPSSAPGGISSRSTLTPAAAQDLVEIPLLRKFWKNFIFRFFEQEAGEEEEECSEEDRNIVDVLSPFGMSSSQSLGPSDMFAEGWTDQREGLLSHGGAPSSSSSSKGTTSRNGGTSAPGSSSGSHEDGAAGMEVSVPWCPPLQEKQIRSPKLRNFQLFYGDTNLFVFIRHYQVTLPPPLVIAGSHPWDLFPSCLCCVF